MVDGLCCQVAGAALDTVHDPVEQLEYREHSLLLSSHSLRSCEHNGRLALIDKLVQTRKVEFA